MNAKHTKNDLSADARQCVIVLLNRQLAETLDLKLRAKQALWNARGTKFGSLRDLCHRVARMARDASEVLARRAVELGGVAEATIQGVIRNSIPGLHPFALARAPDHLWAFCGACARYAASAREAIRAADLTGDHDTGGLLIQISRAADRFLWRIGANICEIWDRAVVPAGTPFRTPIEHVGFPRSAER